MRLSLRQAVFLGNKVLIGFQVDTLVFQIHCSSLYHHSSDTSNGDMSGWRLVYVHCEGLAMSSPTSLHSLLLLSSSGTPPFLRTFSPGVVSTLVGMCVPGTIRLVRVHSAMGLPGLLGWVGLIDQLCCCC